MKIALVLCALVVIPLVGCGTQPSAPPATAAVPAGEPLPPSEEAAKARLERSPRHGEYVDIKLPSGGAPIRTWIVYPERKDKAGVALVIHEVYGLSDWLRGVADQLAQEGFIAVAPDLISGLGPGGGGTESVPSRDDVVKLVRTLTPADANARLDAVRAWAVSLPSSNGRSATIGFCWGGRAELRVRRRTTGAGRRGRLLRCVARSRRPGKDRGAGSRPLRRRRRQGQCDDSAGRGGDEAAVEVLRGERLRGRGARLSEGTERTGGREPPRDGAVLAAHGRLPPGEARLRFLVTRPRAPSAERGSRSSTCPSRSSRRPWA
jgi:hypothetical protein